MSLLSSIRQLFEKNKQGQRYHYLGSGDDVIFKISEQLQNMLNNQKADPTLLHQHIYLKMLAEQGAAEIITNGFMVDALVVTQLDDAGQTILDLPEQWIGKFHTNIKGLVNSINFKVNLSLSLKDQIDQTENWKQHGAFIYFGEHTRFTLTYHQLLIFKALEAHQESTKSEYDNLMLIYNLQQAKNNDINIDLAHFDQKLSVSSPETIGIQFAEENDNIYILPTLGTQKEFNDIQKRLGQLRPDNKNNILKIGNEIVLLNEQKMAVINEILKNPVIKKKQFKSFLENPSRFIDASLVDLDLGFSIRVQGITQFKHAYFGETEASNINWFSQFTNEIILKPTQLSEYIDDMSSLDDFIKRYKSAQALGSDVLNFEGKSFDMSNSYLMDEAIKSLSAQLTFKEDDDFDRTNIDSDIETKDALQKMERIVVDIQLNDELLELDVHALENNIKNVLCPLDQLNWSNYKRAPFEHQIEGVRWILGLALKQKKGESGGGLLADDMGLGKTFMALAGIEHIYQAQKKRSKQQERKPCLIVAPLSLLTTWKDEIEQTFKISPFKDVIILQSDADLNRFREKDAKAETKINRLTGSLDSLQASYSLMFGKNFGSDRLDLPSRIVITTYQTLRDYQFSLCMIDWGIVVFDEAQNIKNPNISQTRAAKGLKADFKLITTGTPVENSLVDFWCLMDTAVPGLLGSYQSFRTSYIKPIVQASKSGKENIDEVRHRIGKQLRLKVGALMLRRMKEDHLQGLPSKNIYVGLPLTDFKKTNEVYLKQLHSIFSGQQLDVYDSILKGRSESEKNSSLEYLHYLRNASLHPDFVKKEGGNSEKNRNIDASVKLKSISPILNEIRDKKEKCIIFLVNKNLQCFLSYTLGKIYSLDISIINGDTQAISKKNSDQTRKSLITSFEEKEGFNLIIMSPIAAGVGLTVVGANHVIHLERHWNPAKEAQATDRVYRIGQTKNVHVYLPISHHPKLESFDVNLHKLLSKKIDLKDAIVTTEEVKPCPGSY